jgi:hypothetical protein
MFPRLVPRGRLEENKDEIKQRVKINQKDFRILCNPGDLREGPILSCITGLQALDTPKPKTKD